jgi:hypothetical protein
MRLYLLYIVTTLVLFSCKKNDNPVFNISILETTPTTLTEFQENILVSISYFHPYGYLGFNDPDFLSLEIKDSRLTNADYYHLIPVNPPNQLLSTNGEILIEIDAPFILGTSSIETLEFKIRIKDRQMNWSNQIVTPSITVNRE